VPIADSKRKTSYWLLRPYFLELLYQEIYQSWQYSIEVLYKTEYLENITQSQNREQSLSEFAVSRY
jgi:hypothetical protein